MERYKDRSIKSKIKRSLRMPDKTKDVYLKYKHFDELLSNKEFMGNDIKMVILYELWEAIKEEKKEDNK